MSIWKDFDLKKIFLFFSTEYTGKLSINGFPIDMKRYRRQSAYIMQDSNLQPLLTVKEAMHFSANLKIGDKMTKESKRLRVSLFHRIFKNLKLTIFFD